MGTLQAQPLKRDTAVVKFRVSQGAGTDDTTHEFLVFCFGYLYPVLPQCCAPWFHRCQHAALLGDTVKQSSMDAGWCHWFV